MFDALPFLLGFVFGAKLTLIACYLGFQWALRTPRKNRAITLFGATP